MADPAVPSPPRRGPPRPAPARRASPRAPRRAACSGPALDAGRDAAGAYDAVDERGLGAHSRGQTHQTREADQAFAARGTCDPRTRLARVELAVVWRAGTAGPGGDGRCRSMHVLWQLCHPLPQLAAALRAADFAPTRYDAERDLGLADQAGRVFVVACRTPRCPSRPRGAPRAA